jgi:hypothetical protein
MDGSFVLASPYAAMKALQAYVLRSSKCPALGVAGVRVMLVGTADDESSAR